MKYLLFYGCLIFVATLVQYFRSLSNICGFCLIFYVFVKSSGGFVKSSLSGLCTVCRGFVNSFGASPPPPPPPLWHHGGGGRGGRGGAPSPGPSAGAPPPACVFYNDIYLLIV